MVQAGYVGGSGGRLNTSAAITGKNLQRFCLLCFPHMFEDGTYTESFAGNVLVSAAGVTLKGLTVTGDMIIGEGVGNGDVTLDGTTVMGRVWCAAAAKIPSISSISPTWQHHRWKKRRRRGAGAHRGR
jgi:hypothetical protein